MTRHTVIGFEDEPGARDGKIAQGATGVWTQVRNRDAILAPVFPQSLTYMMEDPRNIGVCTHLLFGTKNPERSGDHATNVAESIHFLVIGVPLTEERARGGNARHSIADMPPIEAQFAE